jgi:hypothetical protein
MVFIGQFDSGIRQRTAALVSARHVGSHLLNPGPKSRGGSWTLNFEHRLGHRLSLSLMVHR